MSKGKNDNATSSSSSSSSSSNALQAIARPNLTAAEQRKLNEKLFEAAYEWKENLTLVKDLINQGANVNTVDRHGTTPLQWAANNGHTKTVLVLLENGANPNAASTFSGETPLYLAANNGYTEIVTALLKKDANPNAVNNGGNTPLHRAASKEHAKIAIVLLQNGANPNAVNNDGDTPLHRATSYGYTKIAIVLLQNGTNPSTRNNNGRTALDVAGSSDIRSFLTNCINFQEELKSIFDKMVESFSKIRAERNGKEEASASSPSTDLDETLKAVRKKFEEDSIELLSKNEGLLSPEFNPFDMAIDNKNHSILHLMANEALKLGDGTERDQYLELLAILAKESRSEKIKEMIKRAIISDKLDGYLIPDIEKIIASYLYDNDTEITQAALEEIGITGNVNQIIINYLQTIDNNLATALHLAANKDYLKVSDSSEAELELEVSSSQISSSSSSSSAANKPKKPTIMGGFLGTIFSYNLDTIFCRNSAAEEENYPATNMAAAASSSSTYSGSKEEEKTAPAARGNNTDNQTPATFVQNPSAAATSSKYQQNKQ